MLLLLNCHAGWSARSFRRMELGRRSEFKFCWFWSFRSSCSEGKQALASENPPSSLTSWCRKQCAGKHGWFYHILSFNTVYFLMQIPDGILGVAWQGYMIDSFRMSLCLASYVFYRLDHEVAHVSLRFTIISVSEPCSFVCFRNIVCSLRQCRSGPTW